MLYDMFYVQRYFRPSQITSYPSPVTYRGRYYYRSGSTTQELTGSALEEFMLRRLGKTWDGVPVPYVGVAEFHRDALW